MQGPRDKVYALLGMASEIDKQRIKPAYKEPPGNTFARATKEIIQKHKRLAILGMCLGPTESRKPEDIRPSWAPDLSVHASQPPQTSLTKFLRGPDPYFKATGESNANSQFSSDKTHLTLNGFVVATINALGFDPNISANDSLRRAWGLVNGLQSSPNAQYKDPWDAFWRTIITNRTSENKPARIEVEGTQSRLWWQDIESESTNRFAGYLDYYKAFVMHASNRGFFATKEGFIGLGLAATRPNDQICLLEGGQTPFILRKAEKPVGSYQVVGETYVHGIMYGEKWSELMNNKSGKRQVFTLI